MKVTERLTVEFEYGPEFIIYGLDPQEPCDHDDHEPGSDHSEVFSRVPEERVLERLKALVERVEARIAAKKDAG